jgi:hypothetical protein
VLWSSEDKAYGGRGTFPPDSADGWRLVGEAAVLLAPAAGIEEPPGEPWPEVAKLPKRRVPEGGTRA